MELGERLEDQVVNPDLISQIKSGKYSDWAAGLDASSLERLIKAVDGYGNAVAELRAAGESLPIPKQPFGSGLDRLYWDLGCLATLHRTGVLDWHMPSGWDRQFSDSGPALVEAYRTRLSLSSQTRWAEHLTDRAFALVLYAVGGYCVRVWRDEQDQLPGFSGTQPWVDRVSASLRSIRKVFHEAVDTLRRRMTSSEEESA